MLSPTDVGDIHNNIRISFVDGPKVNITGDIPEEYTVDFIDLDKNSITYSTTIKNNMWCADNTKYFVNWKVVVKLGSTVVKEEKLTLENKPVKVVLDTQSIGDLIAYIGAVNEFQFKHKCQLHCVVFSEVMRNIFIENYKNISFSGVNERDEDYYAAYKIGWFSNWQGRARRNPQHMCLANIASDILGFGMVDFKPTFAFDRSKKHGDKKYVCIGMQSTAQFKYWNNKTGWDEVVRYLKQLGYEVWCIDRHSSYGSKESMNYMPRGAVDKTGDFPLEVRMEQLSGADFFIGLSSGLSWIAWTVGIPVILISGVGDRFTEFFTPHRVINKSVCHGCTNDDTTKFDKGNWMYCPRKKNFECTTQISSEMVIKEIDKLQTPFYRNTIHKFQWGSRVTTGQKELLYREIFLDNVYESMFEVQDGDIVMDIGAHVGAFSCGAFRKKPKLVVAVEPSAIRSEVLKKNLEGLPVIVVNKGVSKEPQFIKDGLVYDCVVEDFTTAPLLDIMAEAKIDKIDFMKIDCEGGEYDIFTVENRDWIMKNVKKVAGEWHLEDEPRTEAFRKFRDTYLVTINNYEVRSVDGVDIKWDLFNEHFLEYYEEILIYMDNRPSDEIAAEKQKKVSLVVNTPPPKIDNSPEARQSTKLITDPSFYNNLFNLKGKTAVVTGAGGHLGASICMGLVAQGAKVYAIGRDVSKIKDKLLTAENFLKDNIIPTVCDVTDRSQFQSVIDNIGDVDILVNNAFNEKRKPFEQLTDADWSTGMDNILTQQFMCCQVVLPKMTKKNYGNIINIASIYGMIGIDQRAYQVVPSSTAFYCAAKAASIQLTKELAVQYADKGIRVNCISPGHFPKPPADAANANPQYVRGLSDMVPMKRVGCADEIAGGAVFLASDASSYVTGHNLIIDGGRTIW
jgi:autotransporter strand-loop-strand O-heptosyltransferase